VAARVAKDVVSIGVFFVAGKFEVFVEVLENGRGSCDCLDTVHRRGCAFIEAIDNFEAGSPPAVECMYVVLFQRLC